MSDAPPRPVSHCSVGRAPGPWPVAEGLRAAAAHTQRPGTPLDLPAYRCLWPTHLSPPRSSWSAPTHPPKPSLCPSLQPGGGVAPKLRSTFSSAGSFLDDETGVRWTWLSAPCSRSSRIAHVLGDPVPSVSHPPGRPVFIQGRSRRRERMCESFWSFLCCTVMAVFTQGFLVS